MSWVDVISQALGAGAQGIAQQEQVSRQRKQLAMDQMEQQRRQAAVEQEMLLKGAIPGAEIDEAMLPQITQLGLKSRVSKNAAGRPIWAATPEDQLTQVRIEDAQLGIQEAAAKAEIAGRQLAARKLIEDDPDAFMAQPYEKQTLAWRTAGLEGQPAIPMDRYVEMQKANDFLPYQAALARAAATNNGPRALNALQQEQLRKIQMENLVKQLNGIEVNGMVRFPGDDGTKQRAYEQALAAMGGAPMSGGMAAPSGGGPAPGTRRTINGVPAVWDGQGWVPEGQ